MEIKEIYGRPYINESSLSRVLQHNNEHDCGTITAFRFARDCNTGEVYTKAEKKQMNKSLKSKLLKLKYSVTAVKGQYDEGGAAKVQSEDVFFVVDIKDSGNLENDLMKLGEDFEQDSILFIPKGAITGEADAYLIGTNRCPTNDTPYRQKGLKFNKSTLGRKGAMIYTLVGGRPLVMESDDCSPVIPPSSINSLWLMEVYAERNWKNVKTGEIEGLLKKYLQK